MKEPAWYKQASIEWPLNAVLVDQLSPAQVFDGAAFIAFLLLLFLAMLGLGAAYLPFLWCLGAAMVMIAEMVWPPTARGVSRPQVVAIECVGFILPVLCANQLGMIIGQLVVPLAGRIGHIPVDIIVGVLTALSIVTSTRFVIRHWVGRRNKVGYFITVAMATVLVATIGFSIHATVYTDETPKRLYLQHMSRRWHDETGAVTKESNDLLIVTPDYKDIEPLIPYHDAYRDATPCECGEVYCDVPWYMSIQEMFGNGYCLDLDTIPKASVEFEWRPRIAVSSVPALDGNDPKKSTTRTIHVELEGPEHMNMYIPVSRNDAKVIKWDIHEEAELPTTNPLNTYFIFTASGSPWRSYAFSFTIQGTSAHEPYPFAIAGFKFEAPHNSTDYMNDVATALPEWATEAVFTSTWDGFRG
ncbi:hypothetical protein SARC_05435 [Sphaeroforma arctica JP610]|uniref:Endoplasmic reticulum metallopeptidase 1-like C-terminal domain-containing protein n=1 Tax=Sphaeroforma arctica JP610 TaxID=667725 RepID=A0A0L0FZM9_9EUKA|nr:hypothetical protein SARC_05435 [Sphaeroforma arctica JP610]KNC82280.1 hypothetical protein SARC_05435 [Sphaeroforma arctica JP610]|eukprot:XP_014156182.1 hypothetical protein SARC_05435 [Sphaeroforma arctica JP610]